MNDNESVISFNILGELERVSSDYLLFDKYFFMIESRLLLFHR